MCVYAQRQNVGLQECASVCVCVCVCKCCVSVCACVCVCMCVCVCVKNAYEYKIQNLSRIHIHEAAGVGNCAMCVCERVLPFLIRRLDFLP